MSLTFRDVLSETFAAGAEGGSSWTAFTVQPQVEGVQFASDDQPVRCACALCSGKVERPDDPGGAGDPQFWTAGGLDRGGTATNGKTSLTIEEAGAKITRSYPGTTGGWGGSAHVLGTPATVSYSFKSTATLDMPSDISGFNRFTTVQIDATELSLKSWSDVANIRFERVGSGNSGEGAYSEDAHMRFGNYTDGQAGAAAFAYLPGSSALAGDVWVNSSFSYNATPVMGAYGYQVLTHEIGHAIGLSHPGSYNADPDKPVTYTNNADYYEDSRQYSLMSYFNASSTGASHSGFGAAPLLDDIAAAQRLYGANMTTRTGDTVYGFNSTADRPWYAASLSFVPVMAIWDAGGVDTLDFSGYGATQTIDLREGAFSSVGGSRYNVAIARGAVIENAVGGSGADTLIGNASANKLTGGAGADTFFGLGGADVMTGGAGADTFSYLSASESLSTAADVITDFETGVDKIDLSALTVTSFSIGVEGAYNKLDIITSGGVMKILVAGAIRETDVTVVTTTGQTLVGTAGTDTLVGGAGADTLIGKGGADLLTGGAAGDTFVYERVSDSTAAAYDIITDFQTGLDKISLTGIAVNQISTIANGGATFIFAEESGTGAKLQIAANGVVQATDITGVSTNFYMQGDQTANTLIGGAGLDVLDGKTGNDIIVGGGGSDALFGGAGADTFRYVAASDSLPGTGADTIFDFESGADKIDLSPIAVNHISRIINGSANFLFIETAAGPIMQISVVGSVQHFDVLTANTMNYYVIGDAAANVILAGGGKDVIDGGAGDDIIYGGGNTDALFGGAGANTFRYTAVADSLVSAADTIFDFKTGIDKIDLTAIRTGAADKFGIINEANASYLFVDLGGNGTNDMLIQTGTAGLTAADILWGSAAPAASEQTSAEKAVVAPEGETPTTFIYNDPSQSSPDEYDIVSGFRAGVDRIDLSELNATELSTVSSDGSTFIFARTADGKMLQLGVMGALGGDDLMTASGLRLYMQGDAKSDVLKGGAGEDAINGMDGDDILQGGGGADVLFGGAGSDRFVYADANDSSEETGLDTILDFLSGVDFIDFTAMDFTSLVMSLGDETTLVGSTADGKQLTLKIGGAVAASDLLVKDGLGLSIYGPSTDAQLAGGAFGDALYGGDGSDVIIGSGGSDVLFGGAGADTFRFTASSDSTVASADTIFDFVSGADKIDLTAVRTGDQDTFGIVQAGDASYLFVDLGGDGTHDMLIQVVGTLAVEDVVWGAQPQEADDVGLTPTDMVFPAERGSYFFGNAFTNAYIDAEATSRSDFFI